MPALVDRTLDRHAIPASNHPASPAHPSISAMWISFSESWRLSSRSTPPSPPPTTSTLVAGRCRGAGGTAGGASDRGASEVERGRASTPRAGVPLLVRHRLGPQAFRLAQARQARTHAHAHLQRAQGQVADHLLIGELIALGALNGAVQHQDLAKSLGLEHRDVLHRGSSGRAGPTHIAKHPVSHVSSNRPGSEQGLRPWHGEIPARARFLRRPPTAPPVDPPRADSPGNRTCPGTAPRPPSGSDPGRARACSAPCTTRHRANPAPRSLAQPP